MAFAGAGAYHLRRAKAADDRALAPARKGEFLVIVRCRGELRARRSLQITAPRNVPELRIVWMVPPGSKVETGQVAIRFDPSSAQQQLQEKLAALAEAQAKLEQAVAQARITAEQDRLDLAKARYEVERARLEVSKQEIVSAIQGEQSKIELGLAEVKLRVQEATIALHKASDKAKIASLTRTRDEAQAEVDLTKRRLAQMELKAPQSGLILYLPNHSLGWMNRRPFRVGDQAWAGASLAEIPDLDSMEMEGKVDEIDRARIAADSEVRIRMDSLPEITFSGRLTSISPLTQQSFGEWPPVRTFRAYSEIAELDSRLRPGMNGSMDIVVHRLPEAISIPAKALFTRGGKPIVYVAGGKDYRLVEVGVLARNPDEVAVRGLDAGAMVALAEPGKEAETP
jgi:multidrug efflux pump subunit AcrA (membrane-fusion protein)